jgi:tetratricopeptide (TPR) repeat protein
MAEVRKNRAARRKSAPQAQPSQTVVELSLSIAKEGLGLALCAPVPLGPLEALELAFMLPGLKFPLDVSGGVARFRHRRGTMSRLLLSLPYEKLAEHARQRLAGILSPRAPEVTVSARSEVLSIALSCPDTMRALAFDVAPKSRGRTLVLAMSQARGARLLTGATALALAAFEKLIAGHGRVEGAIATFDDIPDVVARAVLPEAGARVPDAGSLQSMHFTWNTLGVLVRLSEDPDARETSSRAALDLESAALTRDADVLLLARNNTPARQKLLHLLSIAPRSPALCVRLAELDAYERDRAESALATLSEADPTRPCLAGALRGELLVRAGRREDAVAALLTGADAEPSNGVAALMLAYAAELTDDARTALGLLDHAIARAPHLSALRKQRMGRALTAGHLDTARADIGHLEASAKTPGDKHDVLVVAASLFFAAGATVESRALLERALRYQPDSAAALARLGMALVAEGRAARGAALLSEAIEKSPSDEATIALARALALLGDRPQAVARLSVVGPDSLWFVEARALEAKLRAELFDLAGASSAYARIRDYAEARPDARAADALLAAITFEEEIRRDPRAAERHRAALAKVAPRVSVPPVSAPTIGPPAPAAPPLHVAPAKAVAAVQMDTPEPNPEGRAEELTNALRANPRDASVVVELANILADLGRSHELVALAFSRLDEGDVASTGEALKAALSRAAKDAANDGRDVDASLLLDAVTALSS